MREWPRAATVCNCTGVTRGQIGDAIALGAAGLADVRRETGASTVCGSCGPLIAELLGVAPERKPTRAFKAIAVASAAAVALALATLLLPVWPTARTIGSRGLPDLLWLDGAAKQASGYTLLALALAAALLSFRKRAVALGDFAAWRVVHAAVGAATLMALFLHTGFRLGSNLNMWLMLSFLGVALAGAAAGLATALEHRLSATAGEGARLRTLAFWLHVLALWPLPLLLAAHVLLPVVAVAINKQNGPRTDAEKRGLEFVADAANKGKNFYTEEMLGKQKYFTAIYADIAVAQACVSCHNAHDESPRKDFKLNDVLGGVVIRIPISD